MNQLAKNAIAFSRGLVTFETGKQSNLIEATTAAAELARLGFALDSNGVRCLSTLTLPAMRALVSDLVTVIRGKVGAKHAYKPFYVNFPESVMEASHAELFINAIVHYWSNGTWEPDQELIARGPLREKVEMSKLRYASEDEFLSIFTEICSANQSLSEFNKSALEWFVKSYPASRLIVPAQVPFKETLATLAMLGVDVPVKNETDVLRIALAMSDVDTAILPLPKYHAPKRPRAWHDTTVGRAEVQKQRDEQNFKKFSRPERKYLLSLLEKTSPRAEELQTRLGRWLRLGEILHVGEFADKFPKSAAAFAAIRKQEPKVRTFNSNVNFAFKQGDVAGAIALLTKRPGEFARRLDSLLRDHDTKLVLRGLTEVVDRVSSKVLLELYEHITKRTEPTERAIITKGARKATSLETIPALPPEVVGEALNTIEIGMRHGMAQLPKLGKVYVDPKLDELGLVKGARTQGDGLRTMARGARLPLDRDARVIRLFIHWYDENGREDLDLSAAVLDKNLKHLAYCAFTNLKDKGMYHSGDIRHRVGSCAEYIDLDLARLPDRARYATLMVYNYNGRPLSSVKDCVAGVMTREKPNSGEIFEPLTVKNTLCPTSKSTSTIVLAVDLEENKLIWMDLDAGNTRLYEGSCTTDELKYALQKPILSIKKLLEMHVEARGGKLVDSPEKAEVVYDFETLAYDQVKLANLATW